MDIANLLEKIISSGLVQSEVASELGCSQSTVSDIKNGKIGIARPSYRIVDSIKRLAKKRGIAFSADLPQMKRKKIK